MNLEDLEFAEGEKTLEEYVSNLEPSADNSISMIKNKAYWTREERVSDLTLRVSTLAYGGTQYSGRKMYESSIILGKWLRENHNTLSLKEQLIIEMGCGSTGIPGIVSMASGASDVVFCDLDGQALLELAANIDENLPLLEQSRISLDIETFKPTYSFYTGDWKDLNDFLSPSPHFPPLVLASEIVYDAILVEPLVRCIDRLISHPSGSMIFCQSRHGRGNLDEFFRMMLKDPYNYKFHQIDVDTEERDFLDDFIFGIFRK